MFGKEQCGGRKQIGSKARPFGVLLDAQYTGVLSKLDKV